MKTVVFSLTPSMCFFPIPTGCPTIQFIYDTNFPESVQTPQSRGQGSAPQDCPHFRCQLQKGWPSYPHFCLQTTNSGAHMTVPLRFNNSLGQLTELRKTLYLHLPVYCKVYNSKKSQTEEIYKSRYGGRGWHRASTPSPSTLPSQHIDVFTNLEDLYIPSSRGFYGRFIR